MTDKELEEKAVAKSLGYNTKYSEDFDLKRLLDNSDNCIQIDRLIHLLREKAYRDGYLAGAKDNVPQWHYPSKGELPELSKRVLVKAKYQEDVYVGEVFSPDAFTVALKRWVLYTDDGDYYYSDKEIIAWQYIEPPEV